MSNVLRPKNGYKINYEHGYIELVGDGKYKEIMVFRSPLSTSDRKGCYEYMTRPSYI